MFVGSTAMVCLFLVVCFSLLRFVVGDTAGTAGCESRMRTWISRQRELFPADRPADPKKLLYFLHIPRTAGRTTHNCFLMPATPPSRRCAKSYDGMKYDISMPDCGLISSHDDFSAMMSLPNTAAVFTSIRDPVTRFLSAYEFAVELAARDAVRNVAAKAPDAKLGKMNTKEVWPWSYLQPIMAEDLVPKAHRNKPNIELGYWERVTTPEGQEYYINRKQNRSEWEVPEEEAHLFCEGAGQPINPYDNELFMSVEAFADNPAAYELIHNGQTLQVLGLTNYSRDPEAADLRTCIIEDRSTAELALEFAKERLRSLWHVGTFETMRPSLSAYASRVGIDLDSLTYSSNKQHAFSYDSDPEDDDSKDTDSQDSKDNKDWLDPELPSTAAEVNKQLKKVSDEASKVRHVVDENANNRDGPEFRMASARSEELASLRDRLQLQLTNIKAGGKVVSRLHATGRARQIVSDDEHLTNKTISVGFTGCETQAQNRASSKRKNVMVKMKRLDGAKVQFSKKARQQYIPGSVLRKVRNINWMDSALHAVATDLAAELVEQERKRGMKELKMPPKTRQAQGSKQPRSKTASGDKSQASEDYSSSDESDRSDASTASDTKDEL